MLVFLLGYMSSGKSFHGLKNSKKLGVAYYDLDSLIELQFNDSIKQIFQKYGENYFREIERDVLLNTQFHNNAIVSTGGGTPCFYNNMEFMYSIRTTIYLQSAVSQLENNLSKSDHRPLISKQKDLYKFVKSQLVLREPIYLHSDYVIDMNTDHENKLFNLLKTLF